MLGKFVFGVLLIMLLVGCASTNDATGSAVARPSTLTVTVKDEAGSFLPDVKVYANSKFVGKTSKYGESKGSQIVILEGLENIIHVRKDGYVDSRPLVVSTSKAGEQRITVILERKKTDLVIHTEGNNHPIEGARVTLFAERDTAPLNSAETDDNGDAQFKDLQDGSYTVTVAQDGYELQRKNVEINYSEKGDYASFYVELLPRAELRVQVEDSQHQPISFAEVSVYTKDEYNRPGNPVPISREFSDEQGKVTFTEVEYNTGYVVVVKKQDYLAQTQEKQLQSDDRSIYFSLTYNID